MPSLTPQQTCGTHMYIQAKPLSHKTKPNTSEKMLRSYGGREGSHLKDPQPAGRVLPSIEKMQPQLPSEHHGPARHLTEIGVFRDCSAVQLVGCLPSPRFAFQLHINLLS